MTSPRAIHLAAGEGSRLRPITNGRPKPLVELGGQSLLERNVETLNDVGVTDQVVATGYRSDQIEELGYDTVHNPVYDETDMVYSLFCAEDKFPEGRDLVISYGDIVYEQSLVDSLLECDAPLCIVIDREWRNLWEARFDDPLEDAETLEVDSSGRIREIGQEPDSFDDIEGQYVGLLKIRSDYINDFAEMYYRLSEPEEGETRSGVEMTHFVQRLIDDGWDVRAVPVDAGWLEVDTTDDLKMYRDRHQDGTLSEFVTLEE